MNTLSIASDFTRGAGSHLHIQSSLKELRIQQMEYEETMVVINYGIGSKFKGSSSPLYASLGLGFINLLKLQVLIGHSQKFRVKSDIIFTPYPTLTYPSNPKNTLFRGISISPEYYFGQGKSYFQVSLSIVSIPLAIIFNSSEIKKERL